MARLPVTITQAQYDHIDEIITDNTPLVASTISDGTIIFIENNYLNQGGITQAVVWNPVSNTFRADFHDYTVAEDTAITRNLRPIEIGTHVESGVEGQLISIGGLLWFFGAFVFPSLLLFYGLRRFYRH